MRSSRKRAQRQRAQADPVARRISAALDATHVKPTNDAANDAVISAAEAGTRRSADSATHVDLAAGAEFIGMQPNENAPRAQRSADASDLLTPEERAAEPPIADIDDPVDEAAMDSFPASDPPSFTPTRAGRASRNPVDHLP